VGPCKAIETSRSVCPHAPAARGASQDRRDRVIPDGRRGEATNDYYIGKGKTFLLGCFAPTICKMLSLHGLLITRCPCGTMQGVRGHSLGLPARAYGVGVLRKTGENGGGAIWRAYHGRPGGHCARSVGRPARAESHHQIYELLHL